MDTMKLSSVISFAGLLLVLLPTMSFAETSVRVTNSTKSTSNSTDNTSSETHVKITTNGETMTFDTSGDESVDWTSEDGSSKVIINNKTVTGSPTQSPTGGPKPTVQTPTPPPPCKENCGSTPAASVEKPLSITDFFDKYFSWLTNLFD